MKRGRFRKDRDESQRSARPRSGAGACRSGDSQLALIEKPIYGGASLARIDGKATFVPMALPGEQALLQIVEEKRGYNVAEVKEIVSASAERVEAQCRYFGTCGGCQYQHAIYAAQLEYKRAILSETLERAGVKVLPSIDVLSDNPWAYRNRIRLAVDGEGRPGYRSRSSHRVVSIDQCPISSPILVKAAIRLAQLLRQSSPALRPAELALFCNSDESALLASIVVNHSVKASLDVLAGKFREEFPGLAGVELVLEGRGDKPAQPLGLWGRESINYRAGDYDYRVDHGAFFQVNRWLVDGLLERVTKQRSGRLAWDLFAGVGLFARRLALQFERVVAVESAPSARLALAQNLLGTPADAVSSSTLDFLRRGSGKERPDLIVLDPPRTGVGPDVTALLNEIAAPRITYVSCDPATLARDLRALIAGGYAIERLTLADLFPQTFHLESIVDLYRR